MENTLKTLNIGEIRTNDSDRGSGCTITGMEVDGIVNELHNDFLELDQQQLAKIITRYNEIIVEMLAKGCKVNTGLFNLKTSIKDSETLKQSLQNSNIEITKETIENNKVTSGAAHATNSARNENTVRFKEKNLMINGETPACGIAFRQWLCKA